MAFALKLPHEVARIIASMHDPYLDRTRAEGGTPSCRAFESFAFDIDPVHPEYTCEKWGNKFVVTERTEILSKISSHPNVSVFQRVRGDWPDEQVIINTSAAHGFFERNRRDRPYNSPGFFRNFVCYD
jgi:hypothetical protein